MRNLSVSVIIPCFNEELVIEHSYQRISATMQTMGLNAYELIFINDGSNDRTLAMLKSFAAADNHIKILSFSRNFGHQPAVSAGIQVCTGNVAIITDADLQDPPECFVEMVQIHLKEQANVVYGVREQRKGETWFKLITSKLFYSATPFVPPNLMKKSLWDHIYKVIHFVS